MEYGIHSIIDIQHKIDRVCKTFSIPHISLKEYYMI